MEFIHRYMPDWAIRIMIGLVVWFVVCYYMITPFIYDRVTLPLRSNYVIEMKKYNKFWESEIDEVAMKTYSDCVYSSYFINNVYEITQWVATITFYKPMPIYLMDKLINTPKYSMHCGEKPWKKKS